MGGRVVEGTGLENRQAGNRLVGSNPTPSAKLTAHDTLVGSLLLRDGGRNSPCEVYMFAARDVVRGAGSA